MGSEHYIFYWDSILCDPLEDFVQSYSSCLSQDRRICGPHLFPLFIIWRDLMIQFYVGGVIWAAWLIFLMRDSSFFFLLLLSTSTLWCPLPSMPPFLCEGIPIVSGLVYPRPDMYSVLGGALPLPVCAVVWSCTELAFMSSEVAVIWCDHQ